MFCIMLYLFTNVFNNHSTVNDFSMSNKPFQATSGFQPGVRPHNAHPRDRYELEQAAQQPPAAADVVAQPPAKPKQYKYLVPPADLLVHPAPARPLPWTDFPSEDFLAKGRLRPGQDRYEANKFNQAASDAIPMNRSIADSREER